MTSSEDTDFNPAAATAAVPATTAPAELEPFAELAPGV